MVGLAFGIYTFTCQNSVPGAGVTEITDQWSPPYSCIFCIILVLCNSFLCQAVVYEAKLWKMQGLFHGR